MINSSYTIEKAANVLVTYIKKDDLGYSTIKLDGAGSISFDSDCVILSDQKESTASIKLVVPLRLLVSIKVNEE